MSDKLTSVRIDSETYRRLKAGEKLKKPKGEKIPKEKVKEMKTFWEFRAENDAHQIDELSNATMGRYASRAMNDVRNSNQARIRHARNRKGTEFDSQSKMSDNEKTSIRKAKNREAGVRRVIKKTTGQDIRSAIFNRKGSK